LAKRRNTMSKHTLEQVLEALINKED